MISALTLGGVLYFVDFAALVRALRLADYRYILIAIALFLLSLLARGMAWRTLLQEQARFSKLFFTINEGYLLNNILPFRLGEIGRAFLLSRTTPLTFWEVFPTILIERAFDVFFSVGMLLSTLPFVFGAPWAFQAAAAAGAIVLVGLISLHLLGRRRERALAMYAQLSARWSFLRFIGQERLRAFFSGLAALTDLGRFSNALVWMALVWALTLAEYYLVLLAFVPQARLHWGAFGLGLTALGVAVPSSPGYVGVFEASLVGALALFNVDPSVAFAYAITVHLLYFLITAGLGAYGLARDGVPLASVYRRVQADAEIPGSG